MVEFLITMAFGALVAFLVIGGWIVHGIRRPQRHRQH